MNGRLRIALVQSRVTPDPGKNLRGTLASVKKALGKGAQVVCLQELFRLPYFPQEEQGEVSALAETVPGPSTEAFAPLAQRHRAVIIVPVFERGEDGLLYNTAAVLDTDGMLLPPYRKVHIPHDPLFWEKAYFTPGGCYRLFQTEHGRFAVLVCYDQWFPEAARAVTLMGAEVIFYPTAIGRIRDGTGQTGGDWREAWETVMRGHAITNGVHVAAANRVGREGQLQFWGSSFACDAFGTVLARASGTRGEVLLADLDLSLNGRVREGWGFLRNRRPDTYPSLTEEGMGGAAPLLVRSGTPLRLGYRMPAEWEPHAATWLAWPRDNDTFADLAAVERSYTAVIAALHRDERVELLVPDRGEEKRVRTLLRSAAVDLHRIRFHRMDYADVWIRDYGPTYVVSPEDPLPGLVHWRFNAWGGKYPDLAGDTVIPELVCREAGMKVYTPGIVLEGGSIDVNGAGTVLVTEQCLLHPNRNPSLSREEIEAYLQEYLGVTTVVWLKEGIAGDDTDGHIDDVARFTGPSTIACAVEDDPKDVNYAALRENLAILRRSRDQDDRPFTIVPLPMPDPVGNGSQLPASYANFYIGNRTVLVPVFGDPHDTRALKVLGKAVPGRNVVGIDCRAMVAGLGALHCISQQQPEPFGVR
ncbi:MAG: agmatine deiminase family protein [Methanomicrobiales archaeon]|nr:agmatine deiminase family protein [Methanomicrobiales archaeon]